MQFEAPTHEGGIRGLDEVLTKPQLNELKRYNSELKLCAPYIHADIPNNKQMLLKTINDWILMHSTLPSLRFCSSAAVRETVDEVEALVDELISAGMGTNGGDKEGATNTV